MAIITKFNIFTFSTSELSSHYFSKVVTIKKKNMHRICGQMGRSKIYLTVIEFTILGLFYCEISLKTNAAVMNTFGIVAF